MKKKEIFKKYYSQTKEEIIEEFTSHYNYYKYEDKSEKRSKEYREKYLKLCEKFLETLEKVSLPKLTDDWWCYNYYLRNDSIDLVLSYCSDLEIENNEVTGATFSEDYVLISEKCDYMTVSEYAKLYNVSEITVRQWIRRGKIRSAKKQGRDWIIPTIADKPQRGFEGVTYKLDNLSQEIIEKFEFLKGYNRMYIFQDVKDKRLFNVLLFNYKLEKQDEIQISNSQREKLELELISSGLAEVEELKAYHT